MQPSDALGDYEGAGEMPDDVAAGLEGGPDRGGGDRSIIDILLSTEPNVGPHDVSGGLDLDAAWYRHAECGLVKMMGSSSMPAVGHFIAAVVSAIREQSGDSSSDASGEDSFEVDYE